MNSTRFPLAAALVLATALLFLPQTRAADTPGSAAWQPLFDGKTLDGWYVFLRGQDERNKDPDRLVQVVDGVIHMYKDAEAGSQQPFGYIATEKDYSSYRLRLEYRWGEKKFAPRARPATKRDSGLLYHVVEDRVWPRSVECQIQEGDTGDFFAISTQLTAPVDPGTTNLITNVSTNRSSGAVQTNQYAVPTFKALNEGGVPLVQGRVGTSLRVIRNPENEREGWNTVEVIVRGDSAVHIVNGKTNNSCTAIREFVGDQWVPLAKGRIALQLEGAEILFRNIAITELED